MAWCEDRKTRHGLHHFIYYRINGAKQKPLNGGYTDSTMKNAIADALKYEANNHAPELESSISIETAILEYIQAGKDGIYRRPDTPGTSLHKEQTLGYFSEQFPKIKLKLIKPEHCKKYLRSLRSRFTPDGVNIKFKQLKALFSFCVDSPQCYIKESPAKDFEISETDYEPTYLINGEIPKLLESCKLTPGLVEAAWVNLNTGLRGGELFRLSKSHILNDCSFIEIPPRSSTTKRGGRFVPIFDSIRPIIERRVSQHIGRLFPEWNTKAAMEQAVMRGIARAEEDFKIPHCRPHDLRHTFAALFVLGGGTEGQLMDILGHTSPATTRRYMKFSKLHLRDQYNKVGRNLAPIPIEWNALAGTQ